MAGSPVVTLTEARSQLQAWTAALEAVRSGSIYSIGGRSVTRQDINEIRGEMRRWHNTALALEAAANGQSRPLGAIAEFPTPGGGSGGLYSDSIWRSPLT